MFDNIKSALKKNSEFIKIIIISNAKIPILKFRNRKYGIDGDISIYNCLVLNIFNYKSYVMFKFSVSLNSLSKILHYYEHIQKLIHVLKFWV